MRPPALAQAQPGHQPPTDSVPALCPCSLLPAAPAPCGTPPSPLSLQGLPAFDAEALKAEREPCYRCGGLTQHTAPHAARRRHAARLAGPGRGEWGASGLHARRWVFTLSFPRCCGPPTRVQCGPLPPPPTPRSQTVRPRTFVFPAVPPSTAKVPHAEGTAPGQECGVIAPGFLTHSSRTHNAHVHRRTGIGFCCMPPPTPHPLPPLPRPGPARAVRPERDVVVPNFLNFGYLNQANQEFYRLNGTGPFRCPPAPALHGMPWCMACTGARPAWAHGMHGRMHAGARVTCRRGAGAGVKAITVWIGLPCMPTLGTGLQASPTP